MVIDTTTSQPKSTALPPHKIPPQMRHKFEVCRDELEQCKLMEFYWNATPDFKAHLQKTTDIARYEFSAMMRGAFAKLPRTSGNDEITQMFT